MNRVSKWGLIALGTTVLFASRPSHAELPASYQSLSAPAKQELLWRQVASSPYSLNDLPTNNPTGWQLSWMFSPRYFKTFLGFTFTNASDEMPEGRPKLIHTYGSTALVEFQIRTRSPDQTRYTGIFESGGIGLIRLSLAAQPIKATDSYTPGLALKILIDGKPSLNFQAMYSLDGQGRNKNFFAHAFTNQVNPPHANPLKFLAWFFSKAIQALPGGAQDRPENERIMPLVEAAGVCSNGTLVEHPIFPRHIVFSPNPDVSFSPDSQKDFRVEFDGIQAKTVLYEVGLRREDGSAVEPVGRIVLLSKFVASRYEDETLFFQHMRRRAP